VSLGIVDLGVLVGFDAFVLIMPFGEQEAKAWRNSSSVSLVIGFLRALAS
jgi:hypothetical protein